MVTFVILDRPIECQLGCGSQRLDLGMAFGPGASDESALIARSLRHDREAFGLLVERYAEPVVTLTRRLVGDREDAEDLAQETFLAAFRSLALFRGEARFSTWLYRIAVNKCRDWLRSRRPLAPLSDQEDDEGAGPELAIETHDPERALLQKELAGSLEQAIQTLPPSHREAFVLKHVEGLSYEEMSEVLSVGRDALKMRVYKARVRLRQILSPLHEEVSLTPEKQGEDDTVD